ncbi:MAG: HEPN domain-containing protein [Candidatus Odinarchaeota archaeon]
MNRVKDWFNQGEYDLSAARTSHASGHYEWACFQSQQAAEKVLKALLLSLNITETGNSLVHLLRRVEEKKPLDEFEELLERCQDLDRHYIQTRYPSSYSSGYPADYYNQKIANTCIDHAITIVSFVNSELGGSSE